MDFQIPSPSPQLIRVQMEQTGVGYIEWPDGYARPSRGGSADCQSAGVLWSTPHSSDATAAEIPSRDVRREAAREPRAPARGPICTVGAVTQNCQHAFLVLLACRLLPRRRLMQVSACPPKGTGRICTAKRTVLMWVQTPCSHIWMKAA
jgi:hypothetical protein